MRTFLLPATLALAAAGVPHAPAMIEVVPLAGTVISPDASRLAYLAGDSLWIRRLDSPGTARAVSGAMADEHRVLHKFLAWTADGRRLAFRSGAAPHPDLQWYDVASGTQHPLLPDSLVGRVRSFGAFYISGPAWDPRGEQVAFAGAIDREPAMSLFLATATTAQVRRVLLPEAVTGLAWRPGGDLSVTIGGTRRPGAVMLIPGGTGAPTVLLRADSGQIFLAPVWHPSGDTLLIPVFQRGRPVVAARGPEGWQRLEWDLPTGTYLGWDLPSGQLLATSLRDPMTIGLAAVDPRSGRKRWLTPATLTAVAATLGRDRLGTAMAVELQSGAHPSDGYLVRMSGADPVNATRVNDHDPGDPTHASAVIQWISPAGDTLHAQLLTPARNAPGRRPVAIVPYGGYTNRYPSPDYFLDELVLRLLHGGWLVVKPNTRGVSSQPQLSGYGRTQLEDTEALVRALSARGIADTARVAIIGHSHGGSMAYYYATHSPLPCATVAINGRADWILQARYDNDGLLPGPLGATPDEAPALYARESPHANAAAVRGPLLAVSGALDGQILPANATVMADSLRAHGRPVTLLAFGDEGHLIERRPNRERLWSAVVATLATGCGSAP